jgi:hypothetical protein
MRFSKMTAFAFAAALSIFAIETAQAQATRTWVSGVGDDVNPCSRTAPCKTFAGAISKTAIGGEINCIDPGGFGAVTITKSITIDCNGTFGSILASGTNGIVVNALNAVVTIRGISINGAGTGLSGIRFLQSGALRVENVKIFNFTDKGVDFVPTGNSELIVAKSEIYNNGAGATNFAINVRPTGAASAITTIDRSIVQNNSTGIIFDTSATSAVMAATIRESTIAGNSNTGVTGKGGPGVFLTVDKSSVNSNGFGIISDGSNVNIQVANTVVVANSTGLTLLNSGKIISFSSNVFSGNLAVNGAPSSTLPAQ